MPILLDSGAKVDIKDKSGQVPLHYASSKSCIRCTKLVISSQTINLKDIFGWTALHFAAESGFLDGLSLFKDNGATFLSDNQGQTPLHRAAIDSIPETVELLLDLFKDYNLNQEDKYGRTALDYAVMKNKNAIANILLKRGGKQGSTFKGKILKFQNIFFYKINSLALNRESCLQHSMATFFYN